MNSEIARRFNRAEIQYLEGKHGKKLCHCSDIEIKKLLAHCCILSGIQKPPADEQKTVIISFLRKYFGTITLEQIEHAFELLAKGDLGRDTQEHYNCISPQYIAGVLRVYIQKFNDVLNRYKTKETSIKSTVAGTPETYYLGLLKMVEKQNVIPLFWAWNEVYEHLMVISKNDANEIITDEKKKLFVINYLKVKYRGAIVQTLDFNAQRSRL